MNDMTNPPAPQQTQPNAAPIAKKKFPVGKTIGIGCLTLIIIAVVAGYFIFQGVKKMMTGSAPFKDSITAVQSNPAAIKALGEPIESNSMPSGSIALNNNDGTVDFSIPVTGPKGAGTIIVKGTKTNGVWSYQTWQLNIDGSTAPIPLSK